MKFHYEANEIGVVDSHIKSELACVGVLGRCIWNDHLGQGKAVEDRSDDPVVVVRDR